MLALSEAYNKSVQEESTLTPEQLKTRHVGKQGACGWLAARLALLDIGACACVLTSPIACADPKRHLEDAVEQAMGDSILQSLNSMLLAELS